MKALVWKGGQTFGLEDVPEPKPATGQVVIKVAAAAICGSDFHLADFGAQPPLIPGHEVAGTVTEIGSGVNGIMVGARVALDPVQRCGSCWACHNGVDHLCINYRHLGDRAVPGGWAQYVAVDAANAHWIAPNVSFPEASLAEPTAVCYESFARAQLKAGQSVLIIGDGPFGFLHAQLAPAFGAAKVVVAGHYDKRLERIAAVSGALVCNTHHQDLEEMLTREVGPPGVDVAIEATGAAPSPNIGLRALRPRGALVIFSYIWKPEALDMGLISMRELNVLGSCRSLGAFEPCLKMVADGKLNTAALVNLQVPLAEGPIAMEALRKRKSEIFKAVLLPF